MRKRYWLIPLILVGGMTLGGAAVAHTSAGHPLGDKFAQTRIGKLLMARFGRAVTLRAELNLTQAQREAVRATLQAHKAELKAAVVPVVEDRRKLRDTVLSDTATEADIRSAANDLGKALGDAAVEVNKVKSELKTSAGLTPAQIQKIEDFRTQNDADVDQFIKETN